MTQAATAVVAAAAVASELPGLWSLSPLAALVGVLVLQFWMMATGRLITKSSHERELQIKQFQVDDWKEIAKEERATNAIHLEQKSKLIEAATIASAFFKAQTPPSGSGGE